MFIVRKDYHLADHVNELRFYGVFTSYDKAKEAIEQSCKTWNSSFRDLNSWYTSEEDRFIVSFSPNGEVAVIMERRETSFDRVTEAFEIDEVEVDVLGALD